MTPAWRLLFLVASAGWILFAPGRALAQFRYDAGGGIIGDALSGTPNIPNTTFFPLAPSGFVGQIIDARVSLYVTHPADQELGIALVSPDNVTVPLVQNRQDAGGSINNSVGAIGANFGTGCADSARTTFQDGVPEQITASTAPYVGTFIPVYPYKLGALDGKFGSQVNGSWSLEITDFRHSNSGILACWSLFLDSTDLIFRNGFQ